jgi:rhodanese-related sulfurtransferase
MDQSHKFTTNTNARRFLWTFGILALVLVTLLSACSSTSQKDAAAVELPKEISVSQAYDLREAGAFILDVREPDEWQQGHIPDATLIPLGELQSRVDELPSDQEIVVVCRSGNRSASGRDILTKAGFDQVTSMDGGMNEWSAAGYPTESGD